MLRSAVPRRPEPDRPAPNKRASIRAQPECSLQSRSRNGSSGPWQQLSERSRPSAPPPQTHRSRFLAARERRFGQER